MPSPAFTAGDGFIVREYMYMLSISYKVLRMLKNVKTESNCCYFLFRR